VSSSIDRRHDVLVVGAGPSGSACAYWLADAGYDVMLLERKRFPREKTCGDGLTPRSVRQLDDMGLAPELAGFHRYDGLRAMAFGRQLELAWPDHPDLPTYGYVVTRRDLDHLVAERAQKVGATLRQGTEATAPVIEDGRVGGAVVASRDGGPTEDIRARYVIVSDGANSRFGRALGAQRDRSLALGMALRGYYRSPRHDEPWIESHLDVRDRTGQVLPGYGWIFPLGDGRVNVGVGLLSTSDRWAAVNTTELMAAFVDTAPRSWGLSRATSCGAPTGGRLPMGLSVGPRAGPGYVVVGDAAGSINPFNGEGIAYAYETGRLAAAAVGQALATGDDGALGDYETALQRRYGLYYQVAQAFVHLIGRPQLMRVCVGTGMYSRTLMEWVLRIMANLLRPDEIGPAEAAYRAVAALAQSAP
jgi:geranylgeranyl reductase family protein